MATEYDTAPIGQGAIFLTVTDACRAADYFNAGGRYYAQVGNLIAGGRRVHLYPLNYCGRPIRVMFEAIEADAE